MFYDFQDLFTYIQYTHNKTMLSFVSVPIDGTVKANQVVQQYSNA